MDRDEVGIHKRSRPISSHLDRTNLVNKGFIIWLLVKFCLRDAAGSPERARWLHLARSGSQSQRAIWFILPARGASHIIKVIMWCVITNNKRDLQTIQTIYHCIDHKTFGFHFVSRYARCLRYCFESNATSSVFGLKDFEKTNDKATRTVTRARRRLFWHGLLGYSGVFAYLVIIFG